MKNVIPAIAMKGVIITSAVFVALLFANALFLALATEIASVLKP